MVNASSLFGGSGGGDRIFKRGLWYRPPYFVSAGSPASPTQGGNQRGMTAVPFHVGLGETFDEIAFSISATNGTALMDVGIYEAGANGLPGALVSQIDQIDVQALATSSAVIVETSLLTPITSQGQPRRLLYAAALMSGTATSGGPRGVNSTDDLAFIREHGLPDAGFSNSSSGAGISFFGVGRDSIPNPSVLPDPFPSAPGTGNTGVGLFFQLRQAP